MISAFRAGDRRALSRLLSFAERREAQFPSIYDELAGARGQARRIGITGPPGAGKSTLVNALITALRKASERVAVLAVDPSSPFTGGALLGDRVRMQDHVLDTGVFVRSMATRGSMGGLCAASLEAADLLDAFGFPHVLVETVGVGQIEHDVVEATDLVVVVLSPMAGDGIQALKAGLMELADIFVINKADLPGASRVAVDLRDMLALRPFRHGEDIPIVACTATTGEGVDDVVAAVGACFERLRSEGRLAERRHARHLAQVRRLVEAALRQRIFGQDGDFAAELDEADLQRPYAAHAALLARIDAFAAVRARGKLSESLAEARPEHGSPAEGSEEHR